MTVFSELFQAHSCHVFRFALFLSGDHDLIESGNRRSRAREALRETERTVTRDVVRDLLTVYLARDASADTRALVEEHLARDPALKAEADGAAAGRITFVVFRDAPVIAAAGWFTAAVFWGWHFWIRRRLAVSGI